MEIKNLNTNSSKNLQLVSTYGEGFQHKYMDLLEFKYSVDGTIYSIRDIFTKLFEMEENNKTLREALKNALEAIDKVETLTTQSIDLLDVRTLKIQKDLDELKDKIKILL